MTPTETTSTTCKTCSPKQMDEGYYRMIAAGWKVHHGQITESDIKTHEFNMMGKLKFKKLKEVDNEKMD